jgi:hypothetical protein
VETTEAKKTVGPANKKHIWIEYRSILAGPKLADTGQLYVIDPVFSIDCGWLHTTFLFHHFLVVKGFLM